MEKVIQDSGLKIRFRDMVNTRGQMGLNMLASGIRAIIMVKALSLTQMALNGQENFTMVKRVFQIIGRR
jgi:hypothetical protein